MGNEPKSKDFSIQQAMQLAQTTAGQQLIALLQASGGADFQSAMQQAAAGDYTKAKDMITRILTDPEARKLLEQLGRK